MTREAREIGSIIDRQPKEARQRMVRLLKTVAAIYRAQAEPRRKQPRNVIRMRAAEH